MTTNVNLYVDQGVDYAVELNVFDANSSEMDINSQTFTAKAKKMFAASPAFTINVNVDTSDGDPNNLILTIPKSTSILLDPGKYRYDVLMDDGINTIKILEGLLIILPTVSL